MINTHTLYTPVQAWINCVNRNGKTHSITALILWVGVSETKCLQCQMYKAARYIAQKFHHLWSHNFAYYNIGSPPRGGCAWLLISSRAPYSYVNIHATHSIHWVSSYSTLESQSVVKVSSLERTQPNGFGQVNFLCKTGVHIHAHMQSLLSWNLLIRTHAVFSMITESLRFSPQRRLEPITWVVRDVGRGYACYNCCMSSSPVLLHIHYTCFSTFWQCHPYVHPSTFESKCCTLLFHCFFVVYKQLYAISSIIAPFRSSALFRLIIMGVLAPSRHTECTGWRRGEGSAGKEGWRHFSKYGRWRAGLLRKPNKTESINTVLIVHRIKNGIQQGGSAVGVALRCTF